MNKNNKKQQIFDFICKKIYENGYPPSIREICCEVNVSSTRTVYSYLEKLEKDGYIKKDPLKPRALKILNRGASNQIAKKETVYIPFVGKVAAGQPITAIENIEDFFPIPRGTFKDTSSLFILNVKGDSMINAGIFDGDSIFVNKQSTANTGEIIVALIDDEATVKRYYNKDTYVLLASENEFYQPIIVKENFSILGKVVGVFRKL